MHKDISLRREIVDLTMSYKWQTPEDGKRMLGWLACASISAALSCRPHVWLSGYPGKTWFVEHILDSLLQPHYHFYASPDAYRAREGNFCPQIIDMADYRDSNKKIIKPRLRDVRKVIQACRAASGHCTVCGDYGPLCFSACIVSWEQPEMTRYETRQFAPVRLGTEMSHRKFSCYESEVNELFGNDELMAEIQSSISDEAEEIAEQSKILYGILQVDPAYRSPQVEICAIRGALSAGWQWWSGTDEMLGYWNGERPIVRDLE